jgi:hypothetical protein
MAQDMFGLWSLPLPSINPLLAPVITITLPSTLLLIFLYLGLVKWSHRDLLAQLTRYRNLPVNLVEDDASFVTVRSLIKILGHADSALVLIVLYGKECFLGYL